MKKLNKLIAFLLVIISIVSAFASSISVNATDGYQAGDVIYVDYSKLPEWFTEDITGEAGIFSNRLYINFTNNTRYDTGSKEEVVIGEDTTKFDPKLVTEKVDNCVYKYVVTEEDAGAKTLMFWRGSDTNLWNNSVELPYSEFVKGFNTAVVTDWTSTGYLTHNTHYDYELDPVLDIKMNEDVKNEFTVSLSCKSPIADDTVTYSYEIYISDTLVSNTNEYTGIITEPYAPVTGIVKAFYADGTIAAMSFINDFVDNGDKVFSAATADKLYAHAVIGNTSDTEAWLESQSNGSVNLFYLPCSADKFAVELYSTYSSDIEINGVTVNPFEIKVIEYEINKDYTVITDNGSFIIRFMRSNAEAAIYVNNDHSVARDLWSYLIMSKENYSSATGAVVNPDSSIDNTKIKKIKGRGNTTWMADKKPFNINYKSAVKVGDMQTTKKYSLLANFQDATMCRNRILYDMGDAVGLRYSCDSRFVDFYIDGVYKGQYQMCQKIEAGSDNLIYDVDDDGYFNEDGTLKDDFSFVAEVPFAEDFFTATNTGINVVIKSPDVEGNNNLYANEVRNYVRQKFEAMYRAVTTNANDLDKYIDIDSFAKAYIIQELGKNWDTHSWYLTYVPDENGNYKFYASPVWDFDNSLGNANGVASDIANMGVTDYTLPTGWWAKYKSGTNNMTYLCTQNTTIMETAKTVWFKKFVPAIDILTKSGITNKEILSKDVYYDRIVDSATMNYRIWEMLVDNGWLAKHTSLNKASFDYETLTYSVDQTATSYKKYSFEGEYNYMIDWLTSRAAWLSNEWKDYYVEGDEVPDAIELSTPDVPTPPVGPVLPNNTISAFVFDSTGKVTADKLSEYGDKSGYPATTGNGTLICSVNDTGTRALEWSAAEYGEDSNSIVPIMTAGSKNPWGENPYLDITVSTKGYENIALSLTSAGSKKCPATWQLAYSTDGESFADIEGAEYTISLDNRKLPTAYFDNLRLPDAVNDNDSITLRLYAVSTVTVSGGSTADNPTGGEFVINNIIITGDKITDTTDNTDPNPSTTPTINTNPTESTGTTNAPSTYILGDANSDGKVNVKDATYIQKFIAGLINTIDEEVADCNSDGKVNVKDATAIQKFIASLPTPYDIGAEKVRK